jgi:hypothetical protein
MSLVRLQSLARPFPAGLPPDMAYISNLAMPVIAQTLVMF